MRAGYLTAAIAAVWFILVGPATAQDKNAVLEGAQKFCAAEYGDRLLGVSIEGENGFACRFAAVEKVATYKVAPTEPEPKWDLDEEDEASAAAVAAKAAAAAKNKRRARAKLRKKKRYKRAKLRKKKRLQRKRKALRTKKRDPFAEFMRKVRKATRKKRSSIEPSAAPRALTS